MLDFILKYCAIILVLLAGVNTAFGQHEALFLNNRKTDTTSILSPFNCLEHKAIPNTVFALSIKNKTDTLSSDFDTLTQSFVISKSNAYPYQKVVWSFRTLPAFLSEPIFLTDSLRLYNNTPFRDESIISSNNPFKSVQSELGSINYLGSFGRGIRVGNNQNLVLDSHLDLQITGDLGDGLFINAAISDQNIPVQPQGNTVQLQEIDQIFINVKKHNHSITAGDFYSNIQSKRWLRYNKKLQGLSYNYADSNYIKNAYANLSIDRGKFERTKLTVYDGNQGPYRLTGQLNQPFVTIIAGTERVYCDGVKLTRGVNHDYTIDYNRGEITFTPKRLINQQQRIIIEYEYLNQIYLSTFIAGGVETKLKKWTLGVNVTQRQDGLSSTNFELSDTAKTILKNAVATEDGVFVPSQQPIKELSASPTVYYKELAPSNCSDLDSVYVFFNNNDTTTLKKYNVTFSFVGAGNGDYNLDTLQTINGNKYVFVPRNSICEKQGSFDAVRLITTPKNLQNITLSSSFADATNTLDLEVGISNYNTNRYNKTTNLGYSSYLAGTKHIRYKKAKAILSISNELISETFKTPSPWRKQEFNRVWNLGNLSQFNQNGSLQSLSNFESSVIKNKSTFTYQLQHLYLDNQYNGFLNHLQWNTTIKGWQIEELAIYLTADRDSIPTKQLSNTFSLKKQWKKSAFNSRLEAKHAEHYNVYSDIIEAGQFQYYTLKSDFKHNFKSDSSSTIEIRYTGRNNRLAPNYNNLSKWAHEISLRQHAAFKHQKINISATYRSQSAFTTQSAPKQYYLGRIQHRYANKKQKWLVSQTAIEIGSGQERSVSFGYLQVQQGLGQYQWIDFNKNEIQEIDEFQIAAFPDSALYIKIVQPTNDFVQTNALNLSQNLNINLGKVKRASKFLKKWSNQNTLNLKRSALQNAGLNPLLKLSQKSLDTIIVGEQLNFRSSLYFNRGQYAFSGTLERLISQSKTFSQQGVQFLSSTKNRLYLNTPIGEAWSASIETIQDFRGLNYGFTSPNNYNLENRSIKPELSYLPNSQLKVNLFTSWKQGTQQELDSVKLIARSLGAELDFNVANVIDKKLLVLKNTNLKVSFSWINNAYNGPRNTAASYAFLEGLSTGKNYVWNINLGKRLGKSLQLNFSYQGRKTGTSKRVIHNGQAQVNALF